MATEASWPDEAAVEAFISAAFPDLTLTALITASTADAALEEWEGMTGHQPFMAEGSDSVRRFDPPGPHAGNYGRLGGGKRVLSLQGSAVTVTSIVVGGTTYTANEDFWLKPYNLGFFTHVVFNKPIRNEPRSIVVTADWGRVPNGEIPNRAYQAVLRLNAKNVIFDYIERRKADPVEWAEADVRERYSFEALNTAGERWLDESMRHANAFILSTAWSG